MTLDLHEYRNKCYPAVRVRVGAIVKGPNDAISCNPQ